MLDDPAFEGMSDQPGEEVADLPVGLYAIKEPRPLRTVSVGPEPDPGDLGDQITGIVVA